MDFNCKLGEDIIPNDPSKKMSKNGKILWEMVERRGLTVVNGTDKCNGVITRMRETVDGVEESVIDFLIVCEKVEPFVESMEIDDKRDKVLTNYNGKGAKKITKTDHNVIEGKFSFRAPRRERTLRKEMYNVMNSDNLKMFKEITSKDNE
mgnify:CR=1 FL=1